MPQTDKESQDENAGPSFEEAMARLEEIVAELQRDDVPLERAFSLWEEGQKLHAHCSGILDRLKRRLEEAQAGAVDDGN